MKVMRLWTTVVCAMTIGAMCTYGGESVVSTNEVGNEEKLKCLDLFSGAGGFSLGFTMAGCEIIGAVEIDKWAAETFQYNHTKAKVIVKDITQVTNDELLEAFPVHPDIIVGGPPCQGFSICRKNAGDPKDPRNSLFVEYLRVVALLKPSVVVVENVPNILNAKAKAKEPVVSILHAELEGLGYHVEHTILIGKSHAFKDLLFRGSNYPEMLASPCAFIEEKDHDFVIGASIDAKFKCRSGERVEDACFEIPAVAIECKTYLDKTMLEGGGSVADGLQRGYLI